MNKLIKRIKDEIIEKLKQNKILCVSYKYIKVAGIFGCPRIDVYLNGNAINIDLLLVCDVEKNGGAGRIVWDSIKESHNIANPDTDIKASIDKCIQFLIEFSQLSKKYGYNPSTFVRITGGTAKKHANALLAELGFDQAAKNIGLKITFNKYGIRMIVGYSIYDYALTVYEGSDGQFYIKQYDKYILFRDKFIEVLRNPGIHAESIWDILEKNKNQSKLNQTAINYYSTSNIPSLSLGT